jgi:hypothetical protein
VRGNFPFLQWVLTDVGPLNGVSFINVSCETKHQIKFTNQVENACLASTRLSSSPITANKKRCIFTEKYTVQKVCLSFTIIFAIIEKA